MIDCPNGDIRDLLPDLLHGRLDASDRARVEQHVASCDDCRAELALLGDLRSTLRRAPVIDTAAIAAAIPPHRAPVRQRGWGGWRVAAAITVIAVGGTSVAIVGHEWRPAPTLPVQRAQSPESMRVAHVAPPAVAESAMQAPTRIVQGAAPESSTVSPAPTASEPVSLAMTGGAIAELSDRQLSTLLDEIETLDALPSEEVESVDGIGGAIPLEQSR